MRTTLTALCLASIAVLMWPAKGAAEVPETLNYTGTLEKDGEPFDGRVEATFRLYDSDTGGQQVWSERIRSMRVDDGEFDAELGSETSLTEAVDSDDLWLEVSVGGTALTPRTHVNSQLAADRAAPSHTDMDRLRSRVEQLEEQLSRYTDVSAPQGPPDRSDKSNANGIAHRVEQLEEKTEAITRTTIDGYPAIVFTGVNVHIRNGEGSTATTNGTGNLVVGYNEETSDAADLSPSHDVDLTDDTRTGSHNVIVGREHAYSTYGGIVAGLNNMISGNWATVTGGFQNVASGHNSSISGGKVNHASDLANSITGGSSNTTGRPGDNKGRFASVTGGHRNDANGDWASIHGGSNNTAIDGRSAIAGGDNNTAIGRATTVTGGQHNKAIRRFASVSGGFENTAVARWASVSGGRHNNAGDPNNRSEGQYTSICGGVEATFVEDDLWGGSADEFTLDD